MSGLVVTWNGTGQNGERAAWAGDGRGTVLAFREDKEGFGDEPPDYRGPAALVRFDTKALEAWIPMGELEGLIPVDELVALDQPTTNTQEAN